MTQSPHPKSVFLACPTLSDVANITLKSTVTSSALNKDFSLRYDTDYLPEAERRGHVLGKSQILYTSSFPPLPSALYDYEMDDFTTSSHVPSKRFLLQSCFHIGVFLTSMSL